MGCVRGARGMYPRVAHVVNDSVGGGVMLLKLFSNKYLIESLSVSSLFFITDQSSKLDSMYSMHTKLI